MRDVHLPAAERDVMACLYRQGNATARELREGLADFRPMAHGSIFTLLKRLEAKGLVTKRKGKVGKAFVYSAAQKPRRTFAGILRQLVQRVFYGDSVALMASLFETRPPTREELEKLQAMLDKLKKGEANE
jgi:BlaI family transcriptional regulator, penicillinase repressor